MTFFLRAAGPVILISLAFLVGWEFAVAAIIFFLSLNSGYFEYLVVGAVLDAVFSFPFGFFTMLALVLILGAERMARFFGAENFTSFAVKIAGLLLLAFIVVAAYLTLEFSAAFIYKALVFLPLLVLSYKFLEKYGLPER
ncbi:MAG: hypothetical protein A3K06_03945 [Candidatus Doudnabacteria bacterium RIFCSPHIGHO2_01_52_17]|uniref:Uncharacterized protein n=1 Tax=Candidatus Doudnabacteria bacterium RIFCSPHIGHO2_01_52_17 TaxID=1817820 RepID=A0A1F5NAB7_9BACT|nr:MAG: hypothetical protein A3K06_03945 [Candidatus Doudnabacteria bacterium RIFCSPHIGHO2_01_52_17]